MSQSATRKMTTPQVARITDHIGIDGINMAIHHIENGDAQKIINLLNYVRDNYGELDRVGRDLLQIAERRMKK